MTVYVLELKDGRYYVGRTSNLEKRLQTHKAGWGSAWTKRYPMVKLLKTYEEETPFYEDMITKKLMHEYGINNVRGGSYSQVFLPRAQYDAIIIELRGASDKCFRCGGDHFVRDCMRDMTSDSSDEETLDYLAELTSRVASSAYRKATRALNWVWSSKTKK